MERAALLWQASRARDSQSRVAVLFEASAQRHILGHAELLMAARQILQVEGEVQISWNEADTSADFAKVARH